MSNKQKRQQQNASIKPSVDALTQENLDGSPAPQAERVKPIYVVAEPKAEQPKQETAAAAPKAEAVVKAKKARSASPLPNGRLTPRQRVIAVVGYANLLRGQVEPKDVNADMLNKAEAVRGIVPESMEGLVLKHFSESASQKGWDHFVRDIKVEMAAPGTWTIEEPKAATPKQPKETIPAEVLELAKQILAQRAAEAAQQAEASIQAS